MAQRELSVYLLYTLDLVIKVVEDGVMGTFRVPSTLDRDESSRRWHKGTFRVPSTLDREW